MAPSRRPTAPRKRLDLELTGFGTLGFAAFLFLAMFIPPGHAGALGFFVRQPLVMLFGNVAIGFPMLVALIGSVFFLEVAAASMIWSMSVAATLYFLLADTSFAAGFIGSGLSGMFHAIFGELTGPVLTLLYTILTFAVTGVSVKRLIARIVVAAYNVRLPPFRSLQLMSNGNDDTTTDESRKRRSRKDSGAQTAQAEAIELPAVLRAPPFPPGDEEEVADIPTARPVRSQPQPSHPNETPALVGQVVDVTPKRRVDTVSEELTWSDDEMVEGRTASPRQRRSYLLPDLSLFDPPSVQITDETSRAQLLVDTLASFGVGAQVVHTERGPSITRYEVRPDKGVKISRISSLADDLALALAATSVRIEAPIPGKSAVGIEVPNAVVSIVAIREIIEALPPLSDIALPMALGKDITGRPVFADLGKMPHLLVAGATGAGKSVCLNNIIASLLACATPDQVQMLMIDPKRVELTVYNGIPHLVKDVITDARMAAGALFEMTKEMDSRYERFAKASVRKIEEYNRKFPDEQLPYVVIIIDELADLMLVAPAKVETTICRLAQLARATGIHLIVATQRPSVDVITGIIKANIPSRIAFAVSSQVDSRTILDMAGAERLLGRGDMLFLPIDAPKPRRAQGALITGDEVSRLVAFWAAQGRPKNLVDVEVVPIEDEESAKTVDPLSYDAARFIIESNYASTAQLQSQFQIGHPRAVRLMKGLEEMKVVGPHEGTKPRKILIGIADLELMSSRFGKGVDDESGSYSSFMESGA